VTAAAANITSQKPRQNCTRFSVQVTCGRGTVLWWQCNITVCCVLLVCGCHHVSR